MHSREHWEHVYSTKAPDAVSWFQPRAETSLRLIEATGVPADSSIIDIGGGASTLVDDLLAKGYERVTVLDVAASALKAAQDRLGRGAQLVTWLAADITTAELPKDKYDLWHDRAVFHFLTRATQREAYLGAVLRAVRPGGHVIVSTFAEDGPSRCSGLPVMRYSAESLHAEFGAPFTLVEHERERHHTPFGTVQLFTYCYCRKSGN
ncbi:MAG: class I SAM-dependent methyltransferase [Acidobacteriota bacterium]